VLSSLAGLAGSFAVNDAAVGLAARTFVGCDAKRASTTVIALAPATASEPTGFGASDTLRGDRSEEALVELLQLLCRLRLERVVVRVGPCEAEAVGGSAGK